MSIEQEIAAAVRTETDGAQLGRYRRVYEASIDAIVVIDGGGRITGFNPAAERTFGYRKDQAIGRELAEAVITPAKRERHRAGLARLTETGESEILNRRIRVPAMRADGSEFPVELVVTRIDERPLRFAAFVRDITEEVRRERELADLARDNAQIINSAGDGIYRLDASGRITYANPAAGYLLGCEVDDLIGCDAHELLHHSHEDGSPYPAEECPIAATRASGEIVHVMTEVFWRADGTPFPVDYTSAPIRDNGQIVGAVCVFADISEQRDRESELRERAEWTHRVHTALSSKRFLLHAQPIFPAGESRPAMYELLVRMRSPQGELMAPADFIPQAERFGLIADIDRWVCWKAIELAENNRVSVNVSAQALSAEGFSDSILERIEARGVRPGNLVFEITETTALSNRDAVVAVMTRLTELGCGLALDDFGTGYGSFTELSSLPVSYLKIDSEFVRDLPLSETSLRSVRAMVSVAKDFGIETIAEGVETEGALNQLIDCGVDHMQGFHLARPAPVEQVLG